MTKSINLSDSFILAAGPRCEEGSFSFPNQSFLTPLIVNTIKQLLKDTIKHVAMKIGAQIRDSMGHVYKIVLGEK